MRSIAAKVLLVMKTERYIKYIPAIGYGSTLVPEDASIFVSVLLT